MRHREKDREKNGGRERGVGKKEKKERKEQRTGATEDKELQGVRSEFSN